MKSRIEELTDQQMKDINGGDGIIAYDPITGQPFPEETGGYPQHNPESSSSSTKSESGGFPDMGSSF